MNDLWTQAVMVMGLVVLAYYFVTLAVNLAVLWASLGMLGRKMRVASAHLDLPEERAEAVSVPVPAFNEEVTILDTVRALLRQDYPRFEVIVVNDGSADGTLDLLRQKFGLRPLDPAGEGPLPCGQVRGLFISESRRDLIVVDKENGGKMCIRDRCMVPEYCSGGFPHSEIPGSMDVCSSPRLIAAYHVFRRLPVPRHSPCALFSLTVFLAF